MKYSEIQDFSVDELKKRLKELRQDYFEARMKNSLGQLGSPIQLRTARRNIARVKTALNQKLAQ